MFWISWPTGLSPYLFLPHTMSAHSQPHLCISLLSLLLLPLSLSCHSQRPRKELREDYKTVVETDINNAVRHPICSRNIFGLVWKRAAWFQHVAAGKRNICRVYDDKSRVSVRQKPTAPFYETLFHIANMYPCYAFLHSRMKILQICCKTPPAQRWNTSYITAPQTEWVLFNVCPLWYFSLGFCYLLGL